MYLRKYSNTRKMAVILGCYLGQCYAPAYYPAYLSVVNSSHYSHSTLSYMLWEKSLIHHKVTPSMDR